VKKEQNGREPVRRLNPQWVVMPVKEEEDGLDGSQMRIHSQQVRYRFLSTTVNFSY
jgi:hypothetical protein